MRRNRDETAEALARAHFDVEPNLKQVFVLEPANGGEGDAPITLLEVVEGTIERGVEPIAFTADPANGIDYPSVVVEVSPGEYQAIREKRLDLAGRGWRIGRELAVAQSP
jgi:hypothetical protein